MAIFQKSWYGTFLPMHENLKKIGPNDFIGSTISQRVISDTIASLTPQEGSKLKKCISNRKKCIHTNYAFDTIYHICTYLPHFTLFLRIVGRTNWTIEIIGKFFRIGKRAFYSEHSWGMSTSSNTSFKRFWTVFGTPNIGWT